MATKKKQKNPKKLKPKAVKVVKVDTADPAKTVVGLEVELDNAAVDVPIPTDPPPETPLVLDAPEPPDPVSAGWVAWLKNLF